jgi:GNAT superfamily N-acetyltransferase
MRIRPFADGDAEAIGALVAASYPDDERMRTFRRRGHGPPVDEPVWRRSLIAETGGAVAGTGTVLHSRLHPLRTGFDIVVAPRLRRRGVATALLRELRRLAPRPLLTRATLADDAATGFVGAQGFRVLERTYEGRVDPATLAGRLPEPRLDTPPSLDEAAAFFDRWYGDTHRWNPPVPRSPERARAVFCGESMVPGSLVGVRDGGRLVAAANLIQPPGHDPGDELYLVWAGALHTHAGRAVDIVAATVRFALEAGKRLRFEVADGNGPVLGALDRLVLLGEATMAVFGEEEAPED